MDSEDKVGTKDKLKLDYEKTTQYFHELAATRFKLLAIVPVVTGAAIGLLLRAKNPEMILAIGLLGFFVTIGILFYDQRNTQLYDAMQIRAKGLEVLLEFEPINNLISSDKERRKWNYGGAFLDRPKRSLKFYGILMWHDRGLAIIYSAAIGGWAFLITNAILQLSEAGSILLIWLQVTLPILIAVLTFLQIKRFDNPTDRIKKLPKTIQDKLLLGKKG